MPAKSFLALTATAAFGAMLASAQAAPNWQYFPTACASDCAQTVEAAYLCEQEYTSSTDIYGCYCEANPSDASTCATCLSSNDAAALASLVTSDITACPAAISSCFFSCSFATCDSTDIACQCSDTYLEAIYNCGSCNTANGNADATQLSDFQSLNASCGAQSYTGAYQDFATVAVASPTGQDAYAAPSLTATGGGDAATGSFAAASGVATGAGTGAAAGTSAAAGTTAAGAAATASGAAAAGTTSHAASASAAKSGATSSHAASGTVASASHASGSASGTAAAASASSSHSSGASTIAAPGLLLAIVGGLVAML